MNQKLPKQLQNRRRILEPAWWHQYGSGRAKDLPPHKAKLSPGGEGWPFARARVKGKPPSTACTSLSLSLSFSLPPGEEEPDSLQLRPLARECAPACHGAFDFPPRFCRRGARLARLHEKNVSPVLGVKCLLPHTLPRLHTNSTQLRYRPKESWCVTVMMVVVVMMLMTMVMITIMFMMVRVEDADVSDGATYNKGSSMNFQNAALTKPKPVGQPSRCASRTKSLEPTRRGTASPAKRPQKQLSSTKAERWS